MKAPTQENSLSRTSDRDYTRIAGRALRGYLQKCSKKKGLHSLHEREAEVISIFWLILHHLKRWNKAQYMS